MEDIAEHALINDTINNRQGTHKEAVSQSIAITILQLQARYLGVAPTKEALNSFYQDCVDLLKKLRVEDFFKATERDLPRNAELKATIQRDLNHTIDVMISRMQEPLNPEFDRVTIYTRNAEQQCHEQIIDLPLNLVLPLVLKAYYDHEKFAHAAGSGNLQQAENDLPLRLASLFECFQRVKSGICHTGIRHELVLLLNHTYADIHIVEDVGAEVLSCLKEQLYALWLTQYNGAVKEQKKVLLTALFTWMSDDNPHELLDLLDARASITTLIKDRLLSHGLNPESLRVKYAGSLKTLDQLLTYLYSNLRFACHANNTVMNQIDALFRADSSVTSLRSNALIRMREWLTEYFDLQNKLHQAQVTAYYTLYQAERCLSQHRDFLIATNNMSTEEIEGLMQGYHRYYQDLAESRFSVLPPITPATQQQAKQLVAQIASARNDLSSETIESFFTLWFASTDNLANQSYLYAILCDQDVQRKIKIEDKTLTTWWTQALTNEQATLHLTPYQINRIFLHAIIFNPDQWTDSFAHMLGDVLLFTEAQFNREDLNAQALKRDAYPPELLAQLHYLKYIWGAQKQLLTGHTSEDELEFIDLGRPEMVMLLPNQVRTAQEWLRIAALLKPMQRSREYQIKRALLQPLLLAFFRNDLLSEQLRRLPSAHRKAFLDILGPDFLRIHIERCGINETRNFFSWLSDDECKSLVLDTLGIDFIRNIVLTNHLILHWILSVVPQADRASFLHTIGYTFLRTLYKPCDNVTYMSKVLSPLEFDEFLDNLGPDYLKTFWHNMHTLRVNVEQLSETSLEKLLHLLGHQFLINIIKQYTTLITDIKVNKLSTAHIKKYIKALGPDVLTGLTQEQGPGFEMLLKLFPIEDRMAILVLLGYDFIKKIISSAASLDKFMAILPESTHPKLLQILGAKFLTSVKPTNNSVICSILVEQSDDKSKKFLHSLGQTHLTRVIQNIDDLTLYAKILSTTKLKLLCQILGPTFLRRLIENPATVLLSAYEQNLSETAWKNYAEALGLDLILSADDMAQTMASIPINERATFISVLGHPYLKKHIKTLSTVQYMNNLLPQSEHKSFLSAFGSKFLRSLVTDKEDFAHTIRNPGEAGAALFNILGYDFITLNIQDFFTFQRFIKKLPPSERKPHLNTLDAEFLKTMITKPDDFDEIEDLLETDKTTLNNLIPRPWPIDCQTFFIALLASNTLIILSLFVASLALGVSMTPAVALGVGVASSLSMLGIYRYGGCIGLPGPVDTVVRSFH